MNLASLFRLLPERLQQLWWNSRWREAVVQWDTGKGKVDPRTVLEFDAADKAAVATLYRSFGDAVMAEEDDEVYRVMAKLLWKYPQPDSYVHDSVKHRTSDYWQHPLQTFTDGTGDCDDWAILLYALLRHAGVPAWRLKLVVHLACRPDGKQGEGHMSVLYLAHRDYEWYTLEGTWYPAFALENFLLTPQKRNPMYGKIYFTFNEERIWAQHDFDLRPRFGKAFIDPFKERP